MAYSECSQNYHRMKTSDLKAFIPRVKKAFYSNNPPFNVQPFPESQMEALEAAYIKTQAAFANGGFSQKGAFLTAKQAVIKGLDDIAEAVNQAAQGNEEIIILGGFKPRKVTRSKATTAPDSTEIITLKRGEDREILTSCLAVHGALFYICILSEGVPLDGKIRTEGSRLIIPNNVVNIQIDYGKGRKKKFSRLKSKETYYIYFIAGNAAGLSSLSEERNIFCV